MDIFIKWKINKIKYEKKMIEAMNSILNKCLLIKNKWNKWRQNREQQSDRGKMNKYLLDPTNIAADELFMSMKVVFFVNAKNCFLPYTQYPTLWI